MLGLPDFSDPEVLARASTQWGYELAYEAVCFAADEARDDLNREVEDLPEGHPMLDPDAFGGILTGIRQGYDDALDLGWFDPDYFTPVTGEN